MNRSARSVRTGAGSRGGLGHRYSDNPEAWKARWRARYAAHPELRERYREQQRERRRAAQLERDRLEVEAEIAHPTPERRPQPKVGSYASLNQARKRLGLSWGQLVRVLEAA